MKILSAAEQMLFDHPPHLSAAERRQIFELPVAVWSAADEIEPSSSRVGFLVSAAYFRLTKRFFPPSDFHDRDIMYAAGQLKLGGSSFEQTTYPARSAQRHRSKILELAGFRPFDDATARLLEAELDIMSRSYPSPVQLFWRAVDWLVGKRIEVPSSNRLTEAVARAIQLHGRAISKLCADAMTDEVRSLLDNLFLRDEADPGQSPFRITLLRKLSQSTRPARIQESLADLELLKEVYGKVAPILSIMNLGPDGIRYFATSVARARTTDLRRRSEDDIRVHLLAFIAHQYYRLHDNLVDVLLASVQTFENAAVREHRDWCFEERKRHERATETLLDDLDTTVFQVLREIREAVADDLLNDQEKVARISHLVQPEQTAEAKSQELRSSIANDAADGHYFDILDARSIRLQNQVSGILKAITFHAAPHIADLEAAIARFVSTDGALDRAAPGEFLTGDERAAVWKDGKFRISLYKVLLFRHVAGAMKSGSLNLEQSYKRRPLESYLIEKSRWQAERDQLLERAGLSEFKDPAPVLKKLDAALQAQFEKTNRAIAEGKNPHFKMLKGDDFRVATPKKDEEKANRCASFSRPGTVCR